jgi:hypothetical protein
MLLSKLWSAWNEAGLNDFYIFLASFILLLILGAILGSIAFVLYFLIAGKQRVLSQTPSPQYCWILLIFVAVTAHIGWLAALVIYGVYRLIRKSVLKHKKSPGGDELKANQLLNTESVDNYFVELNRFLEISNRENKCICYGAGGRTTLLLNMNKAFGEYIEEIVDSSACKINKKIGGTAFIVRSSEILKTIRERNILIMCDRGGTGFSRAAGGTVSGLSGRHPLWHSLV